MKTTPEHIERTLQSIDGMQRAEASPFLYGRIMDKLKQELPEPVYYGTKMVVRFALTMLVIGLINAASVRVVNNQATPVVDEQTLIQQAAQEYFGISNNNGYTY